MKILLLQDRLRSGGTERQSVLLANAFAARGATTTLLTFRPGGALAPTVSSSVTSPALQPFDLGLDWFAPGLLRQVGKRDPNVVLCMGRMANCYAGRIQKALPQTTVIASMRTGKPLPRLFIQSLTRVRHIVANSQEARDTLRVSYGVAPERVTVIYNSLVFPPSTDGSRNEALRQSQGAQVGTTVMLCVAMFRPEKNQRELVEIATQLPAGLDWQLWLAGEGPAHAACEALVAEKNLGHRIKFLGFQRDPSSLYRAADLAVHASWSEALSNFLIESQAHGLPVIAYEAQGIRECFIPGQTGWVIDRNDRTAFRATVLARGQESMATRAHQAAAARAYARQTFDPARQVTAYADLFARLT